MAHNEIPQIEIETPSGVDRDRELIAGRVAELAEELAKSLQTYQETYNWQNHKERIKAIWLLDLIDTLSELY